MTDELTILRQYKDETDVYVARLEDNRRELLRTISAQATLLAEKDVLIDRLQQGALTTLRRVRELEIAAGAVDPLEHGQYAQPAFFPAGEDTPLFTQPALEPGACDRCNRRPAESGLARWQVCDYCGVPVCDTCYYDDAEGNGHYCSATCTKSDNEDRPD